MKPRFLLSLIPLLLLANCGQSVSGRAGDLPILASPAREAAWGPPHIADTPTGYLMTYRNPDDETENISIKGSRKILFALVYPPDIRGLAIKDGNWATTKTPQIWQKTEIAGQKVYYYQSDSPMAGRRSCFGTLGTELKSSDGTRGNYAVKIEGSNQLMRKWLSELRFASQ